MQPILYRTLKINDQIKGKMDNRQIDNIVSKFIQAHKQDIQKNLMNQEKMDELLMKYMLDNMAYLDKTIQATTTEWLQSQSFGCLLGWISKPLKNDAIDKQILKKIAVEYKVIFQYWAIIDQKNNPYTYFIVKVVERQAKLQQFLAHMKNLYPPIVTSFRFKIKESLTFNRYGSYQVPSDMECILCLDKKTMAASICCGKYICTACSSKYKNDQCSACRQQLFDVRQLFPEEIHYHQKQINKSAYKNLPSFKHQKSK